MKLTSSLVDSPYDQRYRQSISIEDMNKRRSFKSKDSKDNGRASHFPGQDKTSSWNILSLKIVLCCIIFCTFMMLLHFPILNHYEDPSQSGYRSRFVDVGWLWERVFDSRYLSSLVVNWTHVSKVLEDKIDLKKHQVVALLNFNSSEVTEWQKLLAGAKTVTISIEHVKTDVRWETLYPEWIDEEEETEVPVCPAMPMPTVPVDLQLGFIAVKLPCRKRSGGNWSRDVARLHLQLAAAKLAAESDPVKVLFVTDCWPVPNLFKCKELVLHEDHLWLYKPDRGLLWRKLQLPSGSCRLSVPLKRPETSFHGNSAREAYATILHSAQVYVCGAIAAAQSIRFSGSTRDLVILVDATISTEHRRGLELAGWKVRTIQRIRNPKAERDAYNEWNYSKFRLWQLTDYDKIIFIDADLLILRNIDFLFEMPEITAIGNNATLFNSGVMVIEPSNCTFQLLMDNINEIESYNGGDQGYLNEIFTWWHRMPKHMNFLKHFWSGDEEEKELKTRLFSAEPPILYVIHYLGQKPWLCFRDYDCNWNNDILHEFASDVAHWRWWKVHDRMPSELQKFCLLRTKQKASLEWDRRQAEKANYSNGHWKKSITDPRLKKCNEKFCYWKSMLWHWGETNWTDNATSPFTPVRKVPVALGTASL